MTDDRIASQSDHDIFDAIVSQMEDPELIRIRVIASGLGAGVLVTVIAVIILAGLGWQLFLAFCSTFVPGMVLVLRVAGRPLPQLRPSQPRQNK